jgi:hypothetical protein
VGGAGKVTRILLKDALPTVRTLPGSAESAMKQCQNLVQDVVYGLPRTHILGGWVNSYSEAIQLT